MHNFCDTRSWRCRGQRDAHMRTYAEWFVPRAKLQAWSCHETRPSCCRSSHGGFRYRSEHRRPQKHPSSLRHPITVSAHAPRMTVAVGASACHGLTSRKRRASEMLFACGRHQRSLSAGRRAFSWQTAHASRTGSRVGAERPRQRSLRRRHRHQNSCGGGMLMFHAGRHVAMPQRQWRPYARAAASVTEPQ